MKKLLLSIVLASAALTMSAQNENAESTTTNKYSVETNSFWNNWFVQGGVQFSSFYSDEGFHHDFSQNPFKKFRSNPQLSVAIGKWFTPGLGLRTKISGIWGKRVTDEDNKGNGFKFWNIQEQAMFNLSNMIYGYNPERLYSLIPFAGAGIARNCNDNKYGIGISVGILNQFRLNNRIALNLELGYNFHEGRFDGIDDHIGRRLLKNFDNIYYAEVGVTVNLGKYDWKKATDMGAVTALYQSQIDDLNAKLREAKAEKDTIIIREAEKPAKTEYKTIKDVLTFPVSVFFELNKYELPSDKYLINVQAIADYSKANDAIIVVTGLADSATGTSEINQTLSEKRAKTVADKLVEMGVKRENIQIVANGGVSTLSPDSHNRRVIIQIADKRLLDSNK